MGGEAQVDSVVEVRHVNPELQGGGRNDGPDGVAPEPVLDVPAFLGLVPGPVRHDGVRPVDLLDDAFHSLPGVGEGYDLGLLVGVDY